MNTLASFLCDCTIQEQQDFAPLFCQAPGAEIPVSQSLLTSLDSIDGIILCGNSALDTVKATANLFFYKMMSNPMQAPPPIYITGGIGHSTTFLYEAFEKEFPEIAKGLLFFENGTEKTARVPESHILAKILEEQFKIPSNCIIIEDKSTNCGNNAEFCVDIILKKSVVPVADVGNNDEDEKEKKSLKFVLIQDPTMQLRSRLSFEHHFNLKMNKDNNKMPFEFEIKSICTPFSSEESTLEEEDNDDEEESAITMMNKKRLCPYSISERYIPLLLGEIPRLRNDENGYGPKGKRFIGECVIPDEVESAFQDLIRKVGNEAGERRKMV